MFCWHRSLARWPSPPRRSNRGADLICLATGSNDPVLFGACLEPGQHVTSIVVSNKGVFLQGSVPRPRREFDDAVVARGVTTWDRIADLGELVAGKTHGRRSPDDITVFKQNSDQGVGFMALATSRTTRREPQGSASKSNVAAPFFVGATVRRARAATTTT